MNEGALIANRYEIIQTIGQGGMGDVFRGLDRQTGETVAIKLLKPDIVEEMPGLLERFRREGEALRRLDHPNIVKMLAAVEEDGLHYIVMQYVGGGSLRDLLDKHPQLPVEQVLSIGIELADALTRAHHLKIIHRDLKPENVLLAGDGTPLLTDFGVARIGTRTRVTETGSVIGTYAYLSPESCLGEDLDARADIWSFGVMLYEMLAGQRPFEAEQSTAILLAILNNPLPNLTALRPDTPRALIDLISRMLQKEREQRIPSVRLVGAALEAILEGSDTPLSGILPQPGQPGDPASRFATPTPPITRESAPPESEAPLVIIHGSTPLAAPAPPAVATTTPVPAPAAGRKWWALGVMAAALVVVTVLAVALGVFGGDDGGKNEAPAADQIAQVAPVAPGEYMVLVAQLEPLEGADRGDVTRFIVENLQQTLEVEIPFSTIRIREYPHIITSEEAAFAAAEANGASVVVWGDYAPDLIELNIEIGVTTAFPHLEIDRMTLERTANVRVLLTNERRESIAAPVLGVLNVLHTADGNGYEVTRTLAILNAMKVTPTQIVSGGVAGYLQRAAFAYLEDTSQAIEQYDAAIALEGGNPIPYVFRSAGYLRLGLFDKAMRDAQTAQRIGPPNWTTPLYIEGVQAVVANELDAAIAVFDQIVALRPEDWFAVNYRGTMYYLKGDYTRARADLMRAVELGPTANFPYLLLAMLAARDGHLQEMQTYQQIVIRQFPDPTLSTRLIEGLYGDLPLVVSPMLSAAGNLILGQYERVIVDAEAALAMDSQLADMHLIQGLSYCNLDDFAAAEAAYSRGIEVAPDLVALYALRAEVRARQGDLAGAMQDALTVQHSDTGAPFIALMTSAMEGRWNCKEFFNYDYSQLESQP